MVYESIIVDISYFARRVKEVIDIRRGIISNVAGHSRLGPASGSSIVRGSTWPNVQYRRESGRGRVRREAHAGNENFITVPTARVNSIGFVVVPYNVEIMSVDGNIPVDGQLVAVANARIAHRLILWRVSAWFSINLRRRGSINVLSSRQV